MKRLRIIFLLLLSFYTHEIFSQNDKLNRLLLTTNDSLCIYHVKPLTIFKKYDDGFKKVIFLNNTTISKVIANCKDNRVTFSSNNDTTVFLNNTFLEICYTQGFARTAFNSIVEASKKDKQSEFSDFIKPGKIFCLYKDRSAIKIISLNSCADHKLFDRFLSMIKKEKYFDRIIAIRCGADEREIEQITF